MRNRRWGEISTLAEKLHVTRQYLSAVLRGKQKPSFELALRISLLLNDYSLRRLRPDIVRYLVKYQKQKIKGEKEEKNGKVRKMQR